MGSSQGKSVYRSVIKVTEQYLGPASQRFIDRQVQSHLKKEPRDITSNDLRDLIKWINPAMSVITDNRTVVDEFIGRLRELETHGQRSNGEAV